jgi:hypothetical protein
MFKHYLEEIRASKVTGNILSMARYTDLVASASLIQCFIRMLLQLLYSHWYEAGCAEWADVGSVQ